MYTKLQLKIFMSCNPKNFLNQNNVFNWQFAYLQTELKWLSKFDLFSKVNSESWYTCLILNFGDSIFNTNIVLILEGLNAHWQVWEKFKLL